MDASVRRRLDHRPYAAAVLLGLSLAALLLAGVLPSLRMALLLAAFACAFTGGSLALWRLRRETRERRSADRERRVAEARFGNIVEAAMDPIVTVDDAQRIVVFNGAAEQVFGHARTDVLGQPLDVLIPERFRDVHRAHVAKFGETGTTSRRMGASVLRALRSDGEEFPIEASISQHVDRGRRFYTAIVRDVTARVEAENALRRSKEEMQQLGAAANATREQEKSRIARELHDELGQLLTMLQMDVAWCKDRQPADDAAFAGKLDRMEALLRTTIAATRRISSDLRPLMLDDLGLVPSLEWLVENFAQRTGIVCDLTIAERDLALTKSHATAIFRIVQESLTNIAKHAKATHADIVVESDGDALVVRVDDDGVGFSAQSPRKPHSFGLFGLRERASLIGGTVAITSVPGEGTSVELRVPREALAERV